MKPLGLLIALILFINVYSQNSIIGYWEGAFIKNGNSIQRCNFDFFYEKDTLKASIVIEDWLYYAPFIANVSKNQESFSLNTQHGNFQFFYDDAHEEIIGASEFSSLHLKRTFRKRTVEIKHSSFVVKNGDYVINCTIYQPKLFTAKSLITLVHGRGCHKKEVWQDLPSVLAKQGYAIVTYDDRGSENALYPCSKSTLDDKANDLHQLLTALDSKFNFEKKGVMSLSAGIWTVLRTLELHKDTIDFLGSWVGPATSVYEQQKDCNAAYIKNVLERDDVAIAEANAYIDLSLEKKSNDKVFKEMNALLDSAKLHGWKDVLDNDDIPRSSKLMDELWIRRHQYDPTEALKNLKAPFISILAENDNIVPATKNANRFETIFKAANKTNYKIVIIPTASHSLENGHSRARIEKGPYKIDYFKFDKVYSGMLVELFQYLDQINF